jgi:hypothetical protein
MHDSPRYRDSAAKCLSAAQQACELITAHFISMAVSWLSLARRDEAMDNLLAQLGHGRAGQNRRAWGLVPGPPTFFSGNRL